MNRILIKPASIRSLYFTLLPPPLPYRQTPSSLHFNLIPRTSSSSSSSTPTSTRRMSSSTSPTKNEYLIILPDHADSLQKRLAARPKHFEELTPHIQSGDLLFGGATLSRHAKEGETPDMTGSAMLLKAESEEAVREWLANDAYTKGGVWNLDEAKIYPFRTAVRTAL